MMRSTKLSSIARSVNHRQTADLATRLNQCAISTINSEHLASPPIACSSSTLLAKRHAAFGSRERPQKAYNVYDDRGRPIPTPAQAEDAIERLWRGSEGEFEGGASWIRKDNRYKAGSFKDAFYNDPADNLPEDAVLIAHLEAAVHPPSTSTQQVEPDAYAVLDAATPLLRNMRLTALLDPFVLDIPQILENHFLRERSGSVELPSTQKAVGDVLAACFHRAARRPFRKDFQSYHTKDVQFKVDKAAEAYALYLLDQSVTTSTDIARLEALLETLETGLSVYQRSGSGYRIPVPMVAAWVVLRIKTKTSRQYPFIWPKEQLVTEYLEEFMSNRGVSSTEYVQGIQSLYKSSRMPDFPENLEELNRKLRRYVNDGKEEELIDLWRQFRDHIGTDSPELPPSGLTAPDVRSQVLGAFMHALKTPKFGGAPPHKGELLDQAAEEALSFIPRPYPRHILYELVANRARVAGVGSDAESGDEPYALDRYMDAHPPGSKKEAALKNLRDAWAMANAKGAERDVKLYMLFMEGLGRLGELAQLQMTWNEMIHDKTCRDIWEKEHDPLDIGDTVYPPVKALNQMIQASILVAPNGHAVALELFQQASSPDSAIPCNIITINVVLRYYARKGTLADMQGLFALAGQLGLQPDNITYITLIQGLLRVGQVDMAKGTLGAMHNAGFKTDERLCTLLVSDLAKTGTSKGLQHAEDLMKEMRRTGIETGVHAWTALISGYFRGGWSEDGWDAVRRMEAAQLKFNRVSYNLILQQAGEKIRPDDRGTPATMAIFSRMMEDGIRPGSDTYIILLTPLMKAKMWAEADKVVVLMEKLRFMPDKKDLRELLKKVKLRRALDWETPGQMKKRLQKEAKLFR